MEEAEQEEKEEQKGEVETEEEQQKEEVVEEQSTKGPEEEEEPEEEEVKVKKSKSKRISSDTPQRMYYKIFIRHTLRATLRYIQRAPNLKSAYTQFAGTASYDCLFAFGCRRLSRLWPRQSVATLYTVYRYLIKYEESYVRSC